MYILPIFLCFFSFFLNITLGKQLGFKGSVIMNLSSLFFSFVSAIHVGYEVCFLNVSTYIHIFPFMSVYNLNLYWSFVFDTITCVMLVVILCISSLANIYSVEYMMYDPHKIRFFAYLSLFTWTMIMLVTANSVLQLFFGWECVGITSYLLINFWYTRIQANKSSILAIMANKLGDSLLLFSCLFFLYVYNSMYFSTIFLCEQYTHYRWINIIIENTNVFHVNSNGSIYYFVLKNDIINVNEMLNYNTFFFVSTFICFFIILAAVCKSAQSGFHFWLAEAMEGPTPVSSLLHAATMVTAGVFLTVRCSHIFHHSYYVATYVIFIGALTAFFSSLIGVTQNDIKKIVAYSTCSQLGYMFLSNGIFSYNITMFHLFNHAFFKALLFLTSGYIIHILSNEQDLRKVGAMIKILPLPYVCLCIGSISLMGIPFFSGFFSKDFIIESFYNIYVHLGFKTQSYSLIYFSQLLLSTSVILTITYSVKVIFSMFVNSYKGFYNYLNNIHFSGIFILMPLTILCLLSILTGYMFSDSMIGTGSVFWKKSISMLFSYYDNALFSTIALHSNIGTFFILLPYHFNVYTFYYTLINSLYYMLFIYILYKKYSYFLYKYFLCRKYYVFMYIHINRKLLFYNRILVNGIIYVFMKESYHSTYKLLDKQIFEVFGPFGIVVSLKNMFKYIRFLNTSLIYHYLGIVVLVLIVMVLFVF